MRWAGVLARALLAGAAAAAPQRAGAACAALAVDETQALLEGGAVWQAFAVLGRAEWEVSNATLVALRGDELEQLRLRGVVFAAELAARYRDAVLFVPLALDSLVGEVSRTLFADLSAREKMLCLLNSVVLEERNTFYYTVGKTTSVHVFFRLS
jgi:hypothetical protein